MHNTVQNNRRRHLFVCFLFIILSSKPQEIIDQTSVKNDTISITSPTNTSTMEWPSERVPRGGVFHAPKANYTPETKQYLKLLVDESKMSMMQRKKLDYFLRNGEPFPTKPIRERSKYPRVLIRPGSSKRRSKDTILKSGAYEREQFVPDPTVTDRELAKKRLQEICEFGKIVEPPPPKVIEKRVIMESKKDVDRNRFDELVYEIKERQEWLKEMEELGEGKKYENLIRDQIQERVRQMEKLKIADTPLTTQRSTRRPK